MNFLTTRPYAFLDSADILFRDLGDSFFRDFFDVKKIEYPVDVKETSEGIQYDVAAVGVDKKDISIEINEGVLKISYNKKPEDISKEKYLYKGICNRSFEFAWKLSESKFDLGKVDAKLDKGLLIVKIPFKERKDSKRLISIQ
jgi:HSP20 family protein